MPSGYTLADSKHALAPLHGVFARMDGFLCARGRQHMQHGNGDYFREKPGAGKPPAEICEGGAEWPSYSAATAPGLFKSAARPCRPWCGSGFVG